MKLKKILLQNIRSYKDAEIEFPEGSILLSGDIGSGKSSILLAIEFALFGIQRGKGGDGLLRKSEKEGKVRLNFEIDGKEIIIERTLKRGKETIQQESCSIEIEKEKKELSTNELKSLVLSILNYPQEFLQKNPILYRYTVYTPQEEMRMILTEEPEIRLNTLRRIFDIDKYKRIMENVEKFISKIREEIKLDEGKIKDLEYKKNEKELRKQEILKVKTEIATFSLKLSELKKIVAERKNNMQEYENKIKELNKLKTENAMIRTEIISKNERISEIKRIIEPLKKQIFDSENELKGKSMQDVPNISNEINKKEKEFAEMENELAKISRNLTTFEVNRERSSRIINDIIKLQNCPTCRQEVSEKHKHDIKEKSDNEVQDLEKSLSVEKEKKKILEVEIVRIKQDISLLRIKDKDAHVLKLKFSYLDEKKKQLEKNNESLGSSEKLLVDLEKKRKEMEIMMESFRNSEKMHELSKKMLDEAREEEKQCEISKARFERQLEDTNSILVIIEKEIENMEKTRIRLMKISKLKSWLENEFTQMILIIEKNVLLKVHKEFSDLFGKWFSMLVNELSARIDEDFTPIIEQSGYDIDYAFLSGGERTAAALAYRLALNQVINGIVSNIKTRDILILDEPTDGFSAEQLDKMREVLKELNVKQLILVSHEEKIETFVENVIRLKKDDSTKIA